MDPLSTDVFIGVWRHPSRPCPAHLDKRLHRVPGRQALLLNPKEVGTGVSQATAQQGHNVEVGAGHLHDPPGDKQGRQWWLLSAVAGARSLCRDIGGHRGRSQAPYFK